MQNFAINLRLRLPDLTTSVTVFVVAQTVADVRNTAQLELPWSDTPANEPHEEPTGPPDAYEAEAVTWYEGQWAAAQAEAEPAPIEVVADPDKVSEDCEAHGLGEFVQAGRRHVVDRNQVRVYETEEG